MTRTTDDLPPVVKDACVRLREALLQVLGDDLVALWAYGAATSPEPPKLGWYILDDDARRSEPPLHAFRPAARDTSWPLHRAHCIRDRFDES